MPLFECSRIERREYLVKDLIRSKDEEAAYNEFEKKLNADKFYGDSEFLEIVDISDERCEFVEDD